MTDSVPGLEAIRRSKKNAGARWPAQFEENNRLFPEAWPILTPSFTFKPTDTVFTIGSCFARNIEKYLHQFGLNVPVLAFRMADGEDAQPMREGIVNKYTPPSVYQELKRTADLFDSTVEERKEAFLDLLLPVNDGFMDLEHGGYASAPLDVALQRREEIFQLFRQAFTANVVTITLGLAEAWYDTERQLYIQHMPPVTQIKANRERFVFKRLRYPEAHEFVRKSVELLNSIGNLDKRILITTSPVPLNTTFTSEDIIISNTYSKAVLRAVSGDIANDFANVDYFPSFENVTLSRTDNVWLSDLIHISDPFVGKIVERLLRYYLPAGEPTLSASDAALGRASTLIVTKDADGALAVLATLDQSTPRVALLTALAKIAKGDETAMSELRRLAKDTDMREAEFGMVSVALAGAGYDDDVIPLLERALKEPTMSSGIRIQCLLLLTRSLRLAGRLDEARKPLDEVGKIAPRRIAYLSEAAEYAAATGEHQKSIEFLDMILTSQKITRFPEGRLRRLENQRKMQVRAAAKLARQGEKETIT